ncbi:DMT family transporter [Bacillus safensis]|uniref:DMT family transporter n=1 Tax=Bacillus safensis TaxID=561879 RepID=UPI00339ABA3F
MAYLYLLLAIIGELIGSSMLKAAEGFSKLYPTIGTIISFIGSLLFLSLAMKTIPLNTAYALWSGIGIILTTIISILIWKEKINVASVTGIVLILVGVVILNLFGPGHGEANKLAVTVILVPSKDRAAVVLK